MTRDYHQFREWAEALAAEDPVNHQNMLEYADAWEKDRKWAEIGPEFLHALKLLAKINRMIDAAEKIDD